MLHSSKNQVMQLLNKKCFLLLKKEMVKKKENKNIIKKTDTAIFWEYSFLDDFNFKISRFLVL